MAAPHTDHRVVLRRLNVLRVEEVTPRCRRVVVTGDELDDFNRDGWDLTGFVTEAPDDHVKVFLAADGADAPVLPRQADGHLDWSGSEKPIARDYTVRRYDAEARELALDVVLHGEGPGSEWGRNAQPGDLVHLAGPRSSHHLPSGESILAVGDETALPAIARWIEEIGPGTRFTAVIAVAAKSERQELAPGNGVELDVHWVEPGGSLLATVEALPALAPDTYVWVAGELSAISPLRVHLRDVRDIPAERTQIASYWKQGTTDPEADELALGMQLITMVDGLTPMAIRVAATLGLADLVAAGTTAPVDLVAATGADPLALLALIDHLDERGLFTRPSADEIGLTDLGRLLIDGHPFNARGRLRLDGAEGQMEQAWAGLLHTVRTGEPGHDQVLGGGFWDRLRADDTLARSFDSYIAEWAQQWVPAAVAALAWAGPGHVVDAAGGTGALLAAVLAAAPDARGTLVELPEAVAAAPAVFAGRGVGERAIATSGDIFGRLPEADLVLLAQVVHDWPDADAVRILRAAAHAVTVAGGRVALIERLVDPAQPMGHNARMTLLMRNLFGATERTEADFAALAAEAGLTVGEVRPVGLGLSLVLLDPAAAATPAP